MIADGRDPGLSSNMGTERAGPGILHEGRPNTSCLCSTFLTLFFHRNGLLTIFLRLLSLFISPEHLEATRRRNPGHGVRCGQVLSRPTNLERLPAICIYPLGCRRRILSPQCILHHGLCTVHAFSCTSAVSSQEMELLSSSQIFLRVSRR